MNKPSLTNRPETIVVLKRTVDERMSSILKAGKGEVLKEFEKVCPTDKSFERVKKEMHNIFDEMVRQLSEQ